MSRVQSEKRVVRKSLFQRGPQAIAGDKDPNYVYRFVNDIGSRVANFQSAGCEIVRDENLVVGDNRVFDPSASETGKKVVSNDGTVSYLMRIKKEWHEEDQAAKQAYIDETEGAIKQTASQGADYGSVKLS